MRHAITVTEYALVNSLKYAASMQNLIDHPDLPAQPYLLDKLPEKLPLVDGEPKIPYLTGVVLDESGGILDCVRIEPEKIHRKIRRDADGNPDYADSELPALGVYVTGKIDDDTETLGESMLSFGAVLDVVFFTGDPIRDDDIVKCLISDVDDYFRAVRAGSIREPANEDVQNITANHVSDIAPTLFLSMGDTVVEPVRAQDRGWYTEANLSLTITIETEG